MFSVIYRSIMVTLLLALILCGVYPLTMMGVGKLLFYQKANGGILSQGDQPVGAELIGQKFSRPEYFHGRPSTAGEKGYDAASSSGSNLGPTNPKLIENLKANIKTVMEENPGIQANQIPVDLVTTSASGLDPHISPEGALLQVERVAKVRHLSALQVRDLIRENTDGVQWGIFGEAGVNVLKLNYALDTLAPVKSAETKPESKPQSQP